MGCYSKCKSKCWATDRACRMDCLKACRGEWDKRVVFVKIQCAKFTDETFRNSTFKRHHDSRSTLEGLKIDMIFRIHLDYMHLYCLGIMKKLLLVWTAKAHHKRSNSQVQILPHKLTSYTKFFPRNFSRKTRPLSDLNPGRIANET